MRPLESHETLVLPHEERHTCSHCGLWAKGAAQIDRVFGFRRMGNGTVRVIPWCKRCRVMARRSERATSATEEQSEFERVRGDAPGVVYAIFAADRNLVKWGYTQSPPSERLRTFQTSCPDELRLLGYFAADYFAETELHAELHERHHRGEWFDMDAVEARRIIRERGGQEVACQTH